MGRRTVSTRLSKPPVRDVDNFKVKGMRQHEQADTTREREVTDLGDEIQHYREPLFRQESSILRRGLARHGRLVAEKGPRARDRHDRVHGQREHGETDTERISRNVPAQG